MQGSTPPPPKGAALSASRGASLWVQRSLAAAAALGAIFVAVSIAQQIAATQSAAQPAKIVSAGGLYPLAVSFSRYPAAAGYALPFAIAPAHPITGSLTYTVTLVPDPDVDATPVNASLTRDPRVANRVTGAAEITVRGQWALEIGVSGPTGYELDEVPILAQASGVIPTWLAWLIGLVPAGGIVLYLVARRRAATL